jgi:hypothetical protein
MAIQYFGIDRGAQFKDVATGTSTTSKKIELAVDLTGNATREDVLLGLEAIKNFILSNVSTFAQ